MENSPLSCGTLKSCKRVCVSVASDIGALVSGNNWISGGYEKKYFFSQYTAEWTSQTLLIHIVKKPTRRVKILTILKTFDCIQSLSQVVALSTRVASVAIQSDRKSRLY